MADFHTNFEVNTKITEAIRVKQEELFAEFLAEHDLTDYRHMPFDEERTRMKHLTFRALYGGDRD